MAKKFIGQKFLLQSTAIECLKGFVASIALVMNISRQQFFARSALTVYKDVGIGGCNLSRHFQQTPHNGILCNDGRSFGGVFKPTFQQPVLSLQAVYFQCVAHDLTHFIQTKRLRDVVKCAGLHCADRGVERSITGYQNDHRLGVGELGAFQNSHAIDFFHSQIGQDQIEMALFQRLKSPHACGPCGDIMSLLAAYVSQVFHGGCFVVDNEYFSGTAFGFIHWQNPCREAE